MRYMSGKRPIFFVNLIVLMSCAMPFKAQGQSWRPPVEIEISDPTVNSIVQSTDGYCGWAQTGGSTATTGSTIPYFTKAILWPCRMTRYGA